MMKKFAKGSFVDDPDDNFYRNYTCGAEMN
jgi:hypothetical protein